MSISALYIFDYFGNPVLWRHFREIPTTDITEMFTNFLSQRHGDKSVLPLVQVNDVTLAFIRYNDLYLVAIVNTTANVMLVFVFLYKFVDLMKSYFNELRKESIRDNFVVVHELMDEVLDFGHPQITESNILKEYITQKSNKLYLKNAIPPAVTNAVSWRPEGIKYRQNEVFLDITESIDLLMSAKGSVLRCAVTGSVIMKTRLSGMPELRLGLNDRLLYEMNDSELDNSVELDEVKFHQCVRLGKFETNRNICFIPPDGEFELMSYRLSSNVNPPVWVECTKECYPNRKLTFHLKVTPHRKRFTATNLTLLVPVPSDVDSPLFQAAVGAVTYDPECSVFKWTIKSFQEAKELSMSATFRLPSVTGEKESSPPVQVNFEIPFFTISGIKVEYLRMFEKSKYDSLTWVRYVTQSGCYQIRMREFVCT